MRRSLIFGVLVAVCLGAACLLVAGAQDESDAQKDQPIASARSSFVLPKIFDFERFKQLFNKQYNSLVQELARQKLFLAKAFAAFISAVNYKHRRADYHLGINQLSDQTPEELALRMNKRKAHRQRGASGSASESKTEIEAADEQDVERELRDIVEHNGGEAGLREAAEEILKSAAPRRKRQAEVRDISLEDLIRPPVVVDESAMVVSSIPSNNPNYEPLELPSFGSEDDRKDSEIPEQEASFINSLPGAQSLGFMKAKLVAAFEGAKRGLMGGQSSDEIKSKQPDVVYVDHRESGCFLKPKDQGKCGSCYIFSTIALYEWAHCMTTGKLVSFSEQYPIDCGFRFGLQGCDGGCETEVSEFVDKYGLELQRNYPYRHVEGTCPYPKAIDSKSTGYIRVEKARLKAIRVANLEKVLERIPVLATVMVPLDFSHYGGGVHPGEKCIEEGAHAMLLVGSGLQDGNEYWLFRNSYNATWGESGHFKLNKKSACLDRPESMTLASLGNLYRRNPHYQKFRKDRISTQRDPDAPKDTGTVAGPVNDG